MDLHVWATPGNSPKNISIISPESLACYYLVAILKPPVRIVASCNTNFSPHQSLPVLIGGESPICGYQDISKYLCDTYPSDTLLSPQTISEHCLFNFIQNNLFYINQYNLYINTQNYENHVRKLFLHYLPFPMMYNQPLKYYNAAKQQMGVIGIGSNGGLFLFGSEDADDALDETPAISQLHEKQMMMRNKQKMLLRETRNTLKIMNLLDQYLSEWELQTEMGEKITPAQLLFVAYCACICSDLPSKNLGEIFKQHLCYKWCEQWMETDGVEIEAPKGDEIPSLWNEIKYRIEYIRQ